MQLLAPAVLLTLFVAADAATLRGRTHANPIRRVVDLLQKMQKQVATEGKKEEELYGKFLCYCKTGTSELEASIEAAEQKIPQVQSSLEAAEQLKAQLDWQLKKAKEDRKAAEEALAKAKALRSKEAMEYQKMSGELKQNMDATAKGLVSLKKGMGGDSFLQSASAQRLKRVIEDADISAEDRDAVATFLSTGESSGEDSDYAPASGQIMGILKRMSDTMAKDLSDVDATEQKAIKDYEALVMAKKQEIEALTKSIEAKLESSGQLALEIVEMKEDIEDTQETLTADKKFVAELKAGCTTKAAEWEERCKIRSEELLAIADTVKMLNDDDSLDLFKKALPSASASLLQLVVTGRSATEAARAALASSEDARVALISLALNGGVKNFEKVQKMIDNMITLLGKEHEADAKKRDYCQREMDRAEDAKKVLDNEYEDIEKAMDDAEATVETLTKEIAELVNGIKELDQSVKEATENRQNENADYKAVMNSDTTAMEVLKMAKNRLDKFYNPKMYKKPELAQEGAAPPPPPETWGAYKKKDEENAGVLAMMDTLIRVLAKDMTEAKTEEAHAQKLYEVMVKESSEKRTSDSKAISEKEGAKADLEARLQKMAIEKKDTAKELYAKELTVKDIHIECDWLLKNFDVRKSARDGEIDSLKKAQAVLSGADDG